MKPDQAFAQFEEEPLRRVLAAFARAEGCETAELTPGQAVTRRAELANELAALGLSVDLTRLRTLRALVGAAVPLLERWPRAHH